MERINTDYKRRTSKIEAKFFKMCKLCRISFLANRKWAIIMFEFVWLVSRWEDAIPDFEAALQLDSELASAHVNIGLIYITKYSNYHK